MHPEIFKTKRNVIKLYVLFKNHVIKILKIKIQIPKNLKIKYQQVLII